jgi:hypothetical protein
MIAPDGDAIVKRRRILCGNRSAGNPQPGQGEDLPCARRVAVMALPPLDDMHVLS